MYVIRTPMFQPMKGLYQGVRIFTDTCTYMHTYNTSVNIGCEAVYYDTGVRDINFILSKVQMFEVYTYILYIQGVQWGMCQTSGECSLH